MEGEIFSTCAHWPEGPIKWELVPFPQDKAAGLYLTPFHVPVSCMCIEFQLVSWTLVNNSFIGGTEGM